MILYLLLALPLFLFSQEPSLIEDRRVLPLLNPALKDQKTLKIKLENGLQAVLVSDPNAKQSAAALTVMAGSWQDPDEFPGMAHFLEHMLFLGTSEYPTESEFGRFIAEHGGQTNAFTHSDYTSYMFSVNQDGFKEGLSRFASFFKSPLFNPSGVGRELNAIDQEFAGGFNNEDIRKYHVLKDVADPIHPLHRFQTGNSQSLAKATTADLRKWFNEHYSANLMRLYLISPLPLDSLKALVLEDFGGIENRKLPSFTPSSSVFPDELLGKFLFVESKKNIQTLSFYWQLPAEIPLMIEAKPDELLCYVFGHEGKESLLAELKREGLAEKLGCGSFDVSSKVGLFQIEIGLTTKGVQLIDTVIERVFQTIRRLKEEPFPIELFNDYKRISDLRYQFLEQEEPFTWAMQQASPLAIEPIETFPELSYTIRKFDPHAVTRVLDVLIPSRCLYVLSLPSKELPKALTQKEPWMQVSYAVEKIPLEKLKIWSQAPLHEAILSPGKNPFLATVLTPQNPHDQRSEYPYISSPSTLLKHEGAKVYFQEDPFYQIPRTFVRFQIQSPEIKEGKPQSVVLTDLFVKALEDHLGEINYEAQMANLDIKLERVQGSIQITLEGFTDSLEKYFPSLIAKLANLDLKEEKFQIFKDALKREYENNVREMPVKQIFDLFKGAVFERYSTFTQKKLAIKKIDLASFQDFQGRVFKKTFLKGVITGGLEKNSAYKLATSLDSFLHKNPGSIAPLYRAIVLNLPEEKGPYLHIAHSQAKGDALFLAIEVPGYSEKLRNCQQILSLAMDEAFFTELRTKQQTGYVVTSDAIDLQKHLFSYFAVQSNTHQPEELLWRIEQFIQGYLQDLKISHVPKERFAILKDTLQAKLSEPPSTLNSFGELLFKLGFEVEDFLWLQKREDQLKNLDYEEFALFCDEVLGRTNKRRLALLLSGPKNKEDVFNYTPLKKLKPLIGTR